MSLKGEMVKVENADSYTITDVSRNTTGEYKCSLVDDPTMEASKAITVNCKGPKHGVVCSLATSQHDCQHIYLSRM